jgi:hypothetical protein
VKVLKKQNVLDVEEKTKGGVLDIGRTLWLRGPYNSFPSDQPLLDFRKISILSYYPRSAERLVFKE